MIHEIDILTQTEILERPEWANIFMVMLMFGVLICSIGMILFEIFNKRILAIICMMVAVLSIVLIAITSDIK